MLARELNISQINEICKNTNVPIEVFIHGALCVSYSGRCYLSQALANRSANRGECAQFCRLPYNLEDADGNVLVKDKHLLSLKDMNRSNSIEALLDAGVTSFKIEGRLKDVEYVKNITAYYRGILDEIFSRRKDYIAASSGKAKISFNSVIDDTKYSFIVDDTDIKIVTIPAGYTHNIAWYESLLLPGRLPRPPRGLAMTRDLLRLFNSASPSPASPFLRLPPGWCSPFRLPRHRRRCRGRRPGRYRISGSPCPAHPHRSASA